MKRIIKGLLLTSAMFMFTDATFAATANISVSANSKNVVVGNKVKVTTKVSSSDLGAWKYCISYDSDVLKLEDSSADAGTCVKAGVIGQTDKTETWTFKAIKSGSSKVTVRAYAVYSLETEDQMNTSVGSVTISAKTQAEIEASYSKNNRLKSLSVDGYSLEPEFSNDVKEYTVNVPSEVTKVNINAQVEDGTASLSGAGEKELNEGINTFDIVVTAQNGSSNTFKLNINVEDKNPINIDYNDEEYTLIKRAGLFEAPKGFNPSTIKIDEFEVPSVYNEATNQTLVGFKNKDGEIFLFEYKDGKYERYYEFSFKDLTLNILKMNKSLLPKGYNKYSIIINEDKVEAYKKSKNSNYALVYATDVSTGEKDLYQLDLKNNTAQIFNQELIETIENGNKKILIVLAALLGVIFIEFLIILTSKFKRKKLVNRIKDEKVEKVKTKAIDDAKKETVEVGDDKKKKSVK